MPGREHEVRRYERGGAERAHRLVGEALVGAEAESGLEVHQLQADHAVLGGHVPAHHGGYGPGEAAGIGVGLADVLAVVHAVYAFARGVGAGRQGAEGEENGAEKQGRVLH